MLFGQHKYSFSHIGLHKSRNYMNKCMSSFLNSKLYIDLQCTYVLVVIGSLYKVCQPQLQQEKMKLLTVICSLKWLGQLYTFSQNSAICSTFPYNGSLCKQIYQCKICDLCNCITSLHLDISLQVLIEIQLVKKNPKL